MVSAAWQSVEAKADFLEETLVDWQCQGYTLICRSDWILPLLFLSVYCVWVCRMQISSLFCFLCGSAVTKPVRNSQEETGPENRGLRKGQQASTLLRRRTSLTFLKNRRNVSHEQPCQFYSTLSWRGEVINRPLKALTLPKFNFNQPRKPRADTTATPSPSCHIKNELLKSRKQLQQAACETLLCQILAAHLPPSSNCGIKNK